ncbi:hypothetical protein [Mameliella alba]|uniref:hypothetical protein n=1 Tax=Mameliella alba TaxID=561184 RepID=UPI0010556607|nr:hypothetical protein [Mameliella alba]
MSFWKLETEAHTKFAALVLWTIALSCWGLGVWLEKYVPGAFSASGGVSIALTLPFLSLFLGRMIDHTIGCRVVLFHYRVERSLAEDALKTDPSHLNRASFRDASREVEGKITEFEGIKFSLVRGLKRLTTAEVVIGSVGSAIWALGNWGACLAKTGEITC